MKNSLNRRKFIKTTALSGAALGLAGPFSFGRGRNSPNEKVVVALMGGRGRAGALAESYAQVEGTEIAYIFDVDERPLRELADKVGAVQGRTPAIGTDFRKGLEDSAVDALVIAAPDHWHTPAAILAMQAGKHVYVEKPGSHNPRESELIVKAQKRYGKLVQMGNQQRSAVESIQAMQDISDGLIGEPYYAKAFYANSRGPIGHGEAANVPSWLDYDLWQGPAPRTQYRDNIIHYNWHWFHRWGTGEICNNGTHEIDICRWALGVTYPNKVSSNGGRYHYNDDWEFYDTQNVTYEFPGDKAINWEGRSTNGFSFWDRGRGATIHGTKGTILIDRNGYQIFDLDNKVIKSNLVKDQTDALDTVGGGSMVDNHVNNFAMAIRENGKLNSPIEEGQQSVMLCHLGNISQHVGRTLNTNPENGRIIGDSEAMNRWGREYEKGWEPKV
ncbi:MAG: Gfo/Idh/MocA family oxidoreductase [Balneolales bacterium]